MTARPPDAALAAIAMVSGRVVCVEECARTVEVAYDQEQDAPAIHHPQADCVCASHPDGPEAIALALFVQDELAKYVALADYGEPLPLNRWAVGA